MANLLVNAAAPHIGTIVGAITHQVIKSSFPVAGAKAPTTTKAFGSSAQPDPNAMLIDPPSPPANAHNPFSLDENCVHIAMGYLLGISAHQLVDLSGHMQRADRRGGMAAEEVQQMLGDAAGAKHLQYRWGVWNPGAMPPHDELCEQNDTTKFAILYRRPDQSGHCVVFDEARPTGYLDFQASGAPVPMQRDSGGYIDDNGKFYFLFKTKL